MNDPTCLVDKFTCDTCGYVWAYPRPAHFGPAKDLPGRCDQCRHTDSTYDERLAIGLPSLRKAGL